MDLKPFGVQENRKTKMDLLEKLDQTLVSANKDADKFYNNRNKAAGTRLRAKMQEIKNLATEIRKNVSEIKNNK